MDNNNDNRIFHPFDQQLVKVAHDLIWAAGFVVQIGEIKRTDHASAHIGATFQILARPFRYQDRYCLFLSNRID